ncbi:hypothetical protein DEO72_LG3g1607 [Vigna unguiculata]|uniref:Uncharacterized protein n=1 Tax=Vigna unguiculata TaxID=3917 RepID=A0A4D6LF78_VIGUN|nr:hypothetical protein DEO72_LG3g1607 [Vigna unguiculata]
MLAPFPLPAGLARASPSLSLGSGCGRSFHVQTGRKERVWLAEMFPPLIPIEMCQDALTKVCHPPLLIILLVGIVIQRKNGPYATFLVVIVLRGMVTTLLVRRSFQPMPSGVRVGRSPSETPFMLKQDQVVMTLPTCALAEIYPTIPGWDVDVMLPTCALAEMYPANLGRDVAGLLAFWGDEASFPIDTNMGGSSGLMKLPFP